MIEQLQNISLWYMVMTVIAFTTLVFIFVTVLAIHYIRKIIRRG